MAIAKVMLSQEVTFDISQYHYAAALYSLDCKANELLTFWG